MPKKKLRILNMSLLINCIIGSQVDAYPKQGASFEILAYST